MRVLQFVADGRPGGGTSVVLDLCLGLRARHGIESIVASAPDSYALATASAAGLAARPLDLWRSRLDRSAPVRLRRLIDEVRPDLVHAHGGRAGLAIARASGPVPFVYTVHGYHFATKPWPQRLAGALAERVTGSRAAAIVWVCAADRQLAGRWRLDPGRPADGVIHNGLDLAALPERGTLEPGLIAFLGRLVPQKNPLLAVDVLAYPALRDARLVMIGGGPLEDAVRARARALGVAERVRITGALQRDQALDELRRAAALVLPSLWEGLPLALAEAMAIGVPVVASAVRGVPELVEHGVSGLLRRDPHDVPGFAQDLARLLGDPPFAAELVDGARRAVARIARLDGMVDAHAGLYRSVCNRATASPF
ncbi:glycosyltransferase [Geminicoccus harenae]|uniref:glycosyltransferase n=2 Tax=Geminicoccus harenae TaxID=2498453 RepID=UPI001C9388E0|nr:glycosyltransferase [Geminicoccus harenae]